MSIDSAYKNGRFAAWLCAALLVAGCASASLVFACATPFVAFAVLAAAVMPLRPALITIGLVWAVNQVIGFAILDYPRTASSAMWGLGFAVLALVTTAVAAAMFRRLINMSRFALYPFALVVCYSVYELVMLAMTPVLGGTESFTVEIVRELAVVNALWLAALVMAFELLCRANGLVPSGTQGARPF